MILNGAHLSAVVCLSCYSFILLLLFKENSVTFHNQWTDSARTIYRVGIKTEYQDSQVTFILRGEIFTSLATHSCYSLHCNIDL